MEALIAFCQWEWVDWRRDIWGEKDGLFSSSPFIFPFHYWTVMNSITVESQNLPKPNSELFDLYSMEFESPFAKLGNYACVSPYQSASVSCCSMLVRLNPVALDLAVLALFSISVPDCIGIDWHPVNLLKLLAARWNLKLCVWPIFSVEIQNLYLVMIKCYHDVLAYLKLSFLMSCILWICKIRCYSELLFSFLFYDASQSQVNWRK